MNTKQKTILVVDDDTSVLKLLRSALLPEHRVLFARNGWEALAIAEKELPDLVILDVVMPGLSGYDVLEKLKASSKTKDIPVVFLTSKSQEIDERRGLENGAVDYWTKPFSFDIVRARARNLLEMKQQRDVLAELVVTDGLTGITNRRGFDEVLSREWQRCARSHSPLSVLLIDIDHFKEFNDHYGHLAGDECLQNIAKIITSHVERSSDSAARYGGEEFACVLPETDTSGGLETGEKVRQAVESAKIIHEYNGSMGYLTISVGVSTIVPSTEQPATQLVNLADNALYDAKKSGRNQVVASVPQLSC